VLRHINTVHESNLGVLASVIRGGRISVGDSPSLLT
jgi:MOSC domain-containing protein YiiM